MVNFLSEIMASVVAFDQSVIKISALLGIEKADARILMVKLCDAVNDRAVSWEPAFDHALHMMSYGVWDFENWKRSL